MEIEIEKHLLFYQILKKISNIYQNIFKGRLVNGVYGRKKVLGRVWEKRQMNDVMEEGWLKEKVN